MTLDTVIICDWLTQPNLVCVCVCVCMYGKHDDDQYYHEC